MEARPLLWKGGISRLSVLKKRDSVAFICRGKVAALLLNSSSVRQVERLSYVFVGDRLADVNCFSRKLTV